MGDGGCRPLVGTLHRSRRAWPGATALVVALSRAWARLYTSMTIALVGAQAMVGADRWSARFTALAGHGPALPLLPLESQPTALAR